MHVGLGGGFACIEGVALILLSDGSTEGDLTGWERDGTLLCRLTRLLIGDTILLPTR